MSHPRLSLASVIPLRLGNMATLCVGAALSLLCPFLSNLRHGPFSFFLQFRSPPDLHPILETVFEDPIQPSLELRQRFGISLLRLKPRGPKLEIPLQILEPRKGYRFSHPERARIKERIIGAQHGDKAAQHERYVA